MSFDCAAEARRMIGIYRPIKDMTDEEWRVALVQFAWRAYQAGWRAGQVTQESMTWVHKCEDGGQLLVITDHLRPPGPEA